MDMAAAGRARFAPPLVPDSIAQQRHSIARLVAAAPPPNLQMAVKPPARIVQQKQAVEEAERSSDHSGEGSQNAGRKLGRLRINLEILLYRAKCLKRMRRQREAHAILRECIRDWPDDGRAYVALGTSLMRSEMFKEARQLYEEGCQAARGENPYVWQAWAMLEERAGNMEKARSLFDAATAADRRHAAAWHGWAMLELRSGNLKKARSLLLKGLKNCGENEYIYQTLAIVEVRSGDIELARTYFVRATQADPKSAASWLAWALMEAEFGYREAVRRLFQRGLQAAPRNRYIWQAWARFEAKEGNQEKARHLFERGIELNPMDVVLQQAHALFEYDSGRPDVARQKFQRAVRTDPKHQPLWLAWGWMEWKEGNLDSARDKYQRCLAVNNRNMGAVKAFQAWAVLEGRAENYSAARTLFRNALRLDSQNMPSWMSWAAMEESCGNILRAEELRTQCFQQKTEVVDSGGWDVNIAELLAPTIEGLSGILNNSRRAESIERNLSFNLGDASSSKWGSGEDFDVDAFLQDKFPSKYKQRNSYRSQ